MQKCNGCEQIKAEPITIPYTVMEAEQTRAERTNKRLWILCIILICVVLALGGFMLWQYSQYETVEYIEEVVVEAEDEGDANYIGNNGDIYNGENNS